MNQTPALPTPDLYTGYGFAIENRANVRTVKCLHCRQAIARGLGRYYVTISVRYHGYLCPACQEETIRFDLLRPARTILLDQIHAFLREHEPLMYWHASSRISDMVYRANLACVEVAQWFLDHLKALETVNYHTICELIREYKQGAA